LYKYLIYFLTQHSKLWYCSLV